MALRDQSGGLFKLAVLLERRSPGRRIRRAPHRAELELGAPVHGEPPFVRAHALGPLNPPPTPPRRGAARRGQFPSWEGSGVGLSPAGSWRKAPCHFPFSGPFAVHARLACRSVRGFPSSLRIATVFSAALGTKEVTSTYSGNFEPSELRSEQ